MKTPNQIFFQNRLGLYDEYVFKTLSERVVQNGINFEDLNGVKLSRCAAKIILDFAKEQWPEILFENRAIDWVFLNNLYDQDLQGFFEKSLPELDKEARATLLYNLLSMYSEGQHDSSTTKILDRVLSTFDSMKDLRMLGAILQNCVEFEQWLSLLKGYFKKNEVRFITYATTRNNQYGLDGIPFNRVDEKAFQKNDINSTSSPGLPFNPQVLLDHNENKFPVSEMEMFLKTRNKYNPSKIIFRGTLINRDISNKYVNVRNGQRQTTNPNPGSEKKVYFFGASEVFCTGLTDDQTVASMFSVIAEEMGHEVVNLGYGGVNFIDIVAQMLSQSYGKDDIAFLCIPVFAANEADVRIHFSDADARHCFIDGDHYSAIGAKRAASTLYDFIQNNRDSNLTKRSETMKCMDYTKFVLRKYRDVLANIEISDTLSSGLQQYKDYLRDITAVLSINAKASIGSVAVNCNPITKGHLHLIKYAAERMDHVFVIVIEEDKSYFSFVERLRLVQLACSGMENVTVIKGGNFVCSEYILPEYYYKDDVQSAAIDCSLEAYFFGKHIAPLLNINTIFLGDEPTCIVTRSYNEQMLEYLPFYDIEVEIIPRVKSDDGQIISASKVRETLISKQYEELSYQVPPETLDELIQIHQKKI